MSNVIKIGNLTIDSFKVGAADCSIYLGTTKLYPQGEPPTPVGFKYKLTLSNGDIVSAETDATSAITQAEISAYTSTTVAVEIGECVTSIGTNAFRNFSGITSVEIPDSVVSISDGAFRSCTNLASISLPSSLTSIGGGAFRSCTNLASVVIPNSVSSISYDVFSDCVSLTSVTIPSSVTSIGYTAFKRCSGLTSVDIPSGVTRIAFEAFSYCTNLERITVEAVVPPTLEQNVFYGSTCPIYVPCESVEAYKSASVWSTYESRITCIPTPTYQWVSYETGDTVPTATTVYGVKLYANYDEGYNVIFSGTTGDYIKFHPNGNFGQWSAEDENGTPIDISSYYQAGSMMYTIEFSDLGLGGMNIISPTTIFEDDIDLYIEPTHEYVDLGLPSGTLWAKTNIGASSETDYGNYYQYGKGADDYQVTSGQSDYSGTENPLAASADTATQAWGGSWHTPTQAQFEELTANTTYEWTTINGVNGGKFTAQNGNYVFFPAAGEYDWRGYLMYDGNMCYYRSSSFYQDTISCTPRFQNGSVLVTFGVQHKEGCSIRPVMDN